MLFDISKVTLDEVHDDLFDQKHVQVYFLRLDKIDPLLSGNKLFKLQYFLQECLQSKHRAILTFGGAYSNHLSATAFACKALNLKCTGIVRGERPVNLSHTLKQCSADGMNLKFVSREAYALKESPSFLNNLTNEFGPFILIPEGGYHPLGAKGASHITELIAHIAPTHIVTATGTCTTLAGLLLGNTHAQITGIPVLKGITDTNERLIALGVADKDLNRLSILDGYHFGGYARYNSTLTAFMNECRLKYQLPLDFVYTAKMFFGVINEIRNNSFQKESKIICLHTGGLQGNKSLPLNLISY